MLYLAGMEEQPPDRSHGGRGQQPVTGPRQTEEQYIPQQQWYYGPAPFNPIKEIVKTIKTVLWSTGFLVFMLMLVLSVALLFALTPAIQDWITAPTADGSNPTETLFLILPIPVGIVKLSGLSFQVWHLFMLTILAACFFYGLYDLFTSWLSKKDNALLSMIYPEKASSGLEGVGKLLMATTFFSMVYFLLLGAGGVVPETPGFETLATTELLYRLFSASVYEELVSRVLFIGLPILLMALLLKWKRPYLKFLLGGGMRLNVVTTSWIFISALIFAYAHVPSWDLWKFPQVFISGMALGYAFVAFGLYASILLHFSVNFVTGSVVALWPDNFALQVGVGLAYLIWIIAGSYFFFNYSQRFIRRMREMMGMRTTRQMPNQYPEGTGTHEYYGPAPQNYHYPTSQHPSAHPPPQVTPHQPMQRGFVCRFCGNTSAKYENRAFTCLRCGNPAQNQESGREPSQQN